MRYENYLVQNNVIPKINKIVAESVNEGVRFTSQFHPSRIDIYKASGCFNSVIEIGASYSLHLFHQRFVQTPLIRRFSIKEFQQFLNPQVQQRFNSDGLNRWVNSLGQDLRRKDEVGFPSRENLTPFCIGVEFFPISLTYSDVNKVSIVFTVQFSICKEKRPAKKKGYLWTKQSQRSEPLIFIASLGSIDLTLDALYSFTPYPAKKQVEIFVDMTSATTSYSQPTHDLASIFNKYFYADFPNMINSLLREDKVPLTPRLSLVGQNPANATVNEIPSFDVTVFHIDNNIQQVLVAAFDIMPGNHGIKERVQQFIGSNDYGVISDEYLVERVFKHKWSLGGFMRTIGWVIKIEVEVEYDNDTSIEDGWLYGSITLDNLDVVAIETESNTRTDYIRIGGKSTYTPNYAYIYLNSGGERFNAGDLDIGDTSNIPWGMYTSLMINPPPSIDPEAQEFQDHAYEDAYRHIVFPFFTIQDQYEPIYIRTEGAVKQVYIIGGLRFGGDTP